MRIVIDENITAAGDILGSLGELELVPGREITPSMLRQADALLVRSVTPVDASLLAHTPVRFVGSATSGVDHVDRDWLARQGIGFAYAPGCNANSVVEYLLAAIAACGERLEQLLAGGTVGIVGYGRIGQAVAARLQALGIAWRACDPWLAPQQIPQPAALDDILASDVITLHPELTSQQPWPSHHLLGARQLQQLAPGTLLVNSSRGRVIDNRALLHWLQGGVEATVVLDVWENEPDFDPALLQQVQFGTAHIAGYSYNGKLAATRHLARALAACLGLPLAPGNGGDAGNDLPALQAPLVHGPGLLRSLLAMRFDIAADDRRLRNMVAACAPADVGAGFDRLRKTYPERRELAGSPVIIAAERHADIDLVRQLGCMPVHTA